MVRRGQKRGRKASYERINGILGCDLDLCGKIADG